MTDVWPLVDRWNAASAKAREARNQTVLDLLSRHTVWIFESMELRFRCDTCREAWPCKVFTEIEEVL